MPNPIHASADSIDLSPRLVRSVAIVGSPAAASETIIAQTPAVPDESLIAGVLLFGWCAFTVGTSGTAVRLRLRQTNVGGTVVADSGAVTGGVAAANLLAPAIVGFDASPAATGQVYVMTLQVTAGAATSTVSAVTLAGIAV